MKRKVAVLDDYSRVTADLWPWSTLRDAVDVTTFHDHVADPDALAERLAPFEIVVATRERTPIRRELVERLPALRLLVTTGPRNVSFDMPALAEHGVTVSATGYSIDSTVEMTWALILAATRRIVRQDEAVRRGEWAPVPTMQLWGNTLGIVGLGPIGERVARIGRAFGMRVIAWSRHLDPARCVQVGVEPVDRVRLYADADVVSVHVANDRSPMPAVTDTDIRTMKATAFFVNTSRGYIVDEDALFSALSDNRIAGAGLDVFATEPLPAGHPWTTLSNTVLSPHAGYASTDVFRRWGADVVADIAAYLDGRPMNVITPDQPALDMTASRWGS